MPVFTDRGVSRVKRNGPLRQYSRFPRPVKERPCCVNIFLKKFEKNIQVYICLYLLKHGRETFCIVRNVIRRFP
jgi:hypothetical protein